MTDSTLQQTQLSELGVTAPETDIPAALAANTPPTPTDDTHHGEHPQGKARAKRKPGAQPSNRNSMRFGFRSSRSPSRYIDVACDAVRRQLEDATSANGPISLNTANIINAATRHESAAMKIYAALASEAGQKLSIPEQARLLVDASNLTDRRVKAIGLLNLDRDPIEDLKRTLYGTRNGSNALEPAGSDPTAMGDTDPVPTTWNATAGRFESQGANS